MWHQFDSAQACAGALAADIRFLLEKTLIERDQAVLAVSGGRSPILLYKALSKQDIDWERIHIILVDERYVPSDHPDSNEGLVRQHLLQHHAARATLSGLAYQTHSLEQDVQNANTTLPKPDIIVLGMGEDGHFASLFAHAPQLGRALALGDDQPRYARISPPDAQHERISMTLQGMRHADCLLLEIGGATRRDVFERAALHGNADYPIHHLLNCDWPGARLQVYWHP